MNAGDLRPLRIRSGQDEQTHACLSDPMLSKIERTCSSCHRPDQTVECVWCGLFRSESAKRSLMIT